MKTSTKNYLKLIILASLFSLSCKDASNPVSPLPNVNFTKADSVEAGSCAVYLSSTIKPTDELITDLLYKFYYLRSHFGDTTRYKDTFAFLQTRFLAPWKISELMIKFEPQYINLVNQGLYNEWNRFEKYLRPIHYDLIDALGWGNFKFEENLHPKKLSELYKTLPGVIHAEPITYTWTDQAPFEVFPRQNDDCLSFVFKVGWLLRTDYYYFKIYDYNPLFIGVWKHNEEMPNWWNEAKVNIEEFYNSF